MSRIGDLIEQLCPDGVPFKPLDELVKGASSRAATGTLNGWTYVGVDNLLPDFRGRRDADYLAGADTAIAFEPGDVLVGNIRPYLKKAWLADRAGGASPDVLVLRRRPEARDEVLPSFLYYAIAADPFINFAMQHAKRGKMPRGDKVRMMQFRVPVPGIEVQKEIVRTLDHFKGLEVELQSEIDLRHRQYAHYRDQLMLAERATGVRWKPMGELGDIFRGKRFTKNDYVSEGGVGCIHYGEIYTHYGISAMVPASRLRAEIAPKMRYAVKNDVVLTDVGETVEDVGKAVAWLGEEDVAVHDHCYVFRSDLNPLYVSQYMRTSRFRADKYRHIVRTKVNTLLPDGLPRILLPEVAPEEQARIAGILGRFEDLLSDPGLGLPAEIAARRQQFQHYRNNLMTFEEAVA